MMRTPKTDPTTMSRGSRTQKGRTRRRRPSIRRSHHTKITIAVVEATVPGTCSELVRRHRPDRLNWLTTHRGRRTCQPNAARGLTGTRQAVGCRAFPRSSRRYTPMFLYRAMLTFGTLALFVGIGLLYDHDYL